MTREEAIKKMLRNNKCVGLMRSNNLRLIDEIYNYFESRICKNCKFDYCGCSVQDALISTEEAVGGEAPNLDGFGCNKFERKQ